MLYTALKISAYCPLGYMFRHTATCAWIRTPTVRIMEVTNSQNSSSTHSTIPRHLIYITTYTTSSYFWRKFQKQNFIICK